MNPTPRTAIRRRAAAALAGAITATAGLVATGAGPTSAASIVIGTIDANGLAGHIGVDEANGGPLYEELVFWDTAGQVTSRPDVGTGEVRYEFYPDSYEYDPWVLGVGGVHIETSPGVNVGDVTLPALGETYQGNTAFRIDGDVLASTPVPDGRLDVDTFQVTTTFPDPPRPLPTTSTGIQMGSFSSVPNRGARWTAGVGWGGRYVVFVKDNATGTKVQAFVDIWADAIPTIDLDAICFGFDQCQYVEGGPPAGVAGTFHPIDPTRIVDTRIGRGIDGPVRTGSGTLGDPNPINRRAEIANHTVQVTGVGGVPSAGVSAVLLNVTAISPPGTGFLTLTPKPAHCCGGLALFDDQASLLRSEPSTSNLNVVAGVPVPNLVLARVGAGGKVRIYNSFGPTEIAIDVAGWFGTGGAHTDGDRFTGITPARVFDSRDDTGGPAGKFSAGEQRSVRVAGVGDVPSSATAVVVNITATSTEGIGYTTAFPTGRALPNASNLNYVAGATRANTAVVKVGSGGRISLFAGETPTHLIVDVLGSFGPSGGKVTAIDPIRLVDSRGGTRAPARKLDAEETITFRVAGEAGIPSNATAVIANVTATQTDGYGYLTTWPHGAPAPGSSNVNYGGGDTVPNLVMVKLGEGGRLDLRASVNKAHVLVDVMGYVTP